ncbi:hypothetical protein [Sphingomonas sp. ABOLH]|uniref:hypothetical protein n=1 Tax=Sphingomonas sp. ABOLH TaxID=1985881 RepID=UPI000F7F7A42|nr:hypothetical protein [Sphingomonas sp. ABOLH]RSV32183.1 hypothetical protein CA237_03705 [Sphingomonas sp. ABOLH]
MDDDYVSPLKVEIDENGRRTLSLVRAPGASAPLDGDLRENDDAASFYRAVAARLALFAVTGVKFTYQDSNS